MKKKHTLRNFVVRTNHWPVSILYRCYYYMAVSLFVSYFKKQKEIIAIYQTGGMVVDDIVAGLSDIDFVIIINDETCRDHVTQLYGKICKLLPILKFEERSIYTTQEFLEAYEKDLYMQYKFDPDACNVRLLYGRELCLPGKKTGINPVIGQVCYLWACVIKYFLNMDMKDRVMENYMSYKFSADFAKARIALNSGGRVSKRLAALKFFRTDPDRASAVFIDGLFLSKKHNFVVNPAEINEKSYVFCAEIVESLFNDPGIFYSSPGAVHSGARMRPRFDELGFFITEKAQRKISMICDLVLESYPDIVEGIFLTPDRDYFFTINEENILLIFKVKKTISFKMAKAINRLIGWNDVPQRIFWYELCDDFAFSLNRDDFTCLKSAVLFPDDLEDILSACKIIYAEPAAGPYIAESSEPIFNKSKEVVQERLRQERKKVINFLRHPNMVRLPNIDFQLFFWQSLKLILLETFQETHQSISALSSEHVCSLWNKHGPRKIDWLGDFYEEYKKDLNGDPSTTEIYLARAIGILKELYGSGN